MKNRNMSELTLYLYDLQCLIISTVYHYIVLAIDVSQCTNWSKTKNVYVYHHSKHEVKFIVSKQTRFPVTSLT